MSYLGNLEAVLDASSDEPPESAAPGGGQPHSQRVRKDLRAMSCDGAAFSLMVGVGESFLPAFTLALGMGKLVGALISTVPLLAGAVLQLVSPYMVRRLGSYRRWVVLCATVQATSFIPLMIAALVGHLPVPVVFLLAAVYWGAGMATGPAWNTWAETLIPSPMRARYFARRTRITQAGVLIGFLGGGLALQAGASYGRPLLAFAVIFLAAGVCRYVSAAFISSQSEPVPPNGDQRRVPVREMLGRLRSGNDGKLLLYLLSVYGAVQIAGPFFNPYMLTELKLPYFMYAMSIAAAFTARVLTMPLMGNFAHRCGARRLLWIGGVAIVPLSACWLVSDNFLWVLFIQAVGGIAWGAFELAMLLMFFESIPGEERTSVLTTYNLAHATATVAGTIVGCLVWQALGSGTNAYMTVFALSCVVRAGTLLLLRRVPDGRHTLTLPLETRTIAVRPSTGTIELPILPSEQAAEEPSSSDDSSPDVEPLPLPRRAARLATLPAGSRA